MAYAHRNGFRIHYVKRSQGYPLICITGFMADHTFWPPGFLRILEKEYHLILPDNRGTGNSQINQDTFSLYDLAEDIIGIMDFEKLENAHILGISLGGMIAQELAIEFPQRVNKLILLSTHYGGKNRFFPDEEDRLKLIPDEKLDRETNVKRMLEVLYSQEFLLKNEKSLFKFYLSQREKNKIPRSVILSQIVAAKNFNAENRLNRINSPVMVLQGTEDKIVKCQNAGLLKDRIAECRLQYYEGVGHSIPAEIGIKAARDILEFLRK